MYVQIETDRVLGDALELRRRLDGDRSLRKCAQRLLEAALTVQIKEVTEILAKTQTDGNWGLVNTKAKQVAWRTAAKKLGDEYARKYAEENNEVIESVRRMDVKFVKFKLDLAIACDGIPADTSVRYWIEGWRAAVGAPHGTYQKYLGGCRQDCCRAAWREYKKGKENQKRAKAGLPPKKTRAEIITEQNRAILEQAHQTTKAAVEKGFKI